MEPAYLITWKPASENPEKGWPEAELQKLVRDLHSGGAAQEPWRFARHTGVEVGQRVYLIRQGKRGHALLGFGHISEPPERGSDRAVIEFEALVNPQSGKVFATQDELHRISTKPGVWNTQSSGVLLPDEVAAALAEFAKRNEPVDDVRSTPHFKYGDKPTWRWALEAVQQLGGQAKRPEIEKYILGKVPEFVVSNVDADLRLISVNDYGRSNWSQNRSPRRTDGSNVYDALFRHDTPTGPLYELYDPERHGVWELAADSSGVMRPAPVSESPEVQQAEEKAEAAGTFDASNETDARQKVTASIVQRRGQPKFRRALLSAYAGQCAVTGCSVTEILEAAHIKPYMGDHTNHVSNGLLLRADIHTLFDLGLLRINPLTLLVEIAPAAMAGYAHVNGCELRKLEEADRQPSRAALQDHFERHASRY